MCVVGGGRGEDSTCIDRQLEGLVISANCVVFSTQCYWEIQWLNTESGGGGRG